MLPCSPYKSVFGSATWMIVDSAQRTNLPYRTVHTLRFVLHRTVPYVPVCRYEHYWYVRYSTVRTKTGRNYCMAETSPTTMQRVDRNSVTTHCSATNNILTTRIIRILYIEHWATRRHTLYYLVNNKQLQWLRKKIRNQPSMKTKKI